MAVSQDGVLRVSSCPGQLQMSCADDFLALPLTKTIIGVWWLGDLSRKPLQLSGHGQVISATCFGQKTRPLLLCTASEDFIFIWNIDRILTVANITSDHSSGIPVGKDLGRVQHLSFSHTDRLLTVCIKKEIWVLNIQTSKLDTLLEGHTSLVTCAQFCPNKESIIVSISEDRTFKVWDIDQSCLLYQSAILSAHPFISLAIDPVQDQMAIGSADGKVHMYDLTYDGGFHCLFELDIGKLLQKYWDQKEISAATSYKGPSFISSQPAWQKEQIPEDDKGTAIELEPGTAVFGIYFVKNPEQPNPLVQSDMALYEAVFGPQNKAAIKDVFHVPSIVAIATSACIILLNCNSREPLYILDFQEPVLSSDELDEVQYNISTPGSFAFAQRPDGSVTCMIGSLFQNTVNVVNIKLPMINKENESVSEVLSQRFSQSIGLSSHGNQDEETPGLRGAEMTSTTTITVLSNSPLCSNSPLKAELVPKTATKQHQHKRPSQKGAW